MKMITEYKRFSKKKLNSSFRLKKTIIHKRKKINQSNKKK